MELYLNLGYKGGILGDYHEICFEYTAGFYLYVTGILFELKNGTRKTSGFNETGYC